MTAEHDEQLELALTELTTWHGSVPQLWRRALGAAKPKRARTSARLSWLLRQRLSAGIAASIIVIALGITVAINLPHLGGQYGYNQAARRRAPAASNLRGVEVLGSPLVAYDGPVRRRELHSVGYVGGDETSGSGAFALDAGRRVITPDMTRGMGPGGAGASVATADRFLSPSASDEEDDLRNRNLALDASVGARQVDARQIVRKATVELLTDDVRAVFLKAAMILSEADGEYVQVSSITGSGETAQASLALRVAADRLSDVLNALRELGEVRSEQVAGQDVTAQVVDLEARLRNEQRVETELLDLLEKRNDAPLKEILELRNTLSNVRGEIERLTARRQQLGRLVSLATVLVIIRTDKTQPTDFSIAGYFGDGVTRAWRRGLIFLADTFGVLLSVLVGGLIWWILLVLVFGAIWRYRRRSVAAADKP